MTSELLGSTNNLHFRVKMRKIDLHFRAVLALLYLHFRVMCVIFYAGGELLWN